MTRAYLSQTDVLETATVKVAESTNYNAGTVDTITVTVTDKDAQTLSFAEATQTKTYGDSSFTVTATLSVGDGAVTYSSSDPTVATVNATTGEVTILKAGTAVITATAAETASYAEATVSYTLTVNKANTRLTAPSGIP